jgi:S1-C subfamily serine protease
MMMGDRVVGTGFHIGDNYILTNQHICANGWKRVFVKDEATDRMVKESEEFTMTVRTRHGYRYELEMIKEGENGTGLDTDLCLVKMTPHDLIVFPNVYKEHGDEKPAIGSEVWSMGMPTGEPWIYTFGRMSHPNYAAGQRHVVVMPGVGGQSGSPVFDGHGRFIGVVSEIFVTPIGPFGAAPAGYTLIVPLKMVKDFLHTK